MFSHKPYMMQKMYPQYISGVVGNFSVPRPTFVMSPRNTAPFAYKHV